MKKLKDYEKEIQSCSKCGLCTSYCPLFQNSGNECHSLKGKMIMLDGILNGKLDFNNQIFAYLNECSECSKCFASCPAGIDFRKIIDTALSEYQK